jgi:S-adenosylmethionine uptake transporter
MQSLWMLVTSLCLTFMAVCVKLVSDEYSTLEIVMYRSLVGAIFMGIITLYQKGSIKTQFPFEHAWRAIVGATAFGLHFYSFRGLPLATAVTLNYTSPIWIALVLFVGGLLQGKTRFEWRLVGAILISFVGVVMVLQPNIQQEQYLWGLIGLTSGFLAGLAGLQVRRLGQLGEPEYRVVFYFCVISTIGAGMLTVIGAYMPGSDGIAFHEHSPRGLVLLVLVGLSAAIGQMANTRAFSRGKTLLTANLQYSGIVFSCIWGILIWGDLFGWFSWVGMAVIIASGVAATFFGATAKKTEKTLKGKT